MNKAKQALAITTTALTLTFTANAALADYPQRPINVIVPWSAGGDSDLTTRIWADAVEEELGVPVVVINKTGGGGCGRHPVRGARQKRWLHPDQCGAEQHVRHPELQRTPLRL